MVAELREGANYVKCSIPPPQREYPTTDWKFIPSSELGGDSLGYHWIDDGHFAIYLLDVCGHGIGAALLSLTVINALRMQSLPNVNFRDPGSVLTGMNESFPMSSHNEMFFTLWYGVFDPVGRILQYSGGGHPPAVLIRKDDGGRAVEVVLRSNQLVVGGIPGVRYVTQSCVVPDRCSLFVFSDGVYELERKQGGLLSHEDFIALLAQSFGGETFELDSLLGSLREIQGCDLFQDDLTILQVGF